MLQFEMMLTAYIAVTGFVCAGVLGSFYQLVRSEPVGFGVNYESWLSGLIGVVFCVFAGPFIIMRNTIRGRKIEGRPFGWIVAASAIASLWSFCTGLMILHFVLSTRSTLIDMI